MARTLRIGLNIFPVDPFWVEVIEAATQRAQQLGLELIPISANAWGFQPLSDDERIALVEEILGQGVDAVIGWNMSEALADRVLDAGVPIIPSNPELPIQ